LPSWTRCDADESARAAGRIGIEARIERHGVSWVREDRTGIIRSRRRSSGRCASATMRMPVANGEFDDDRLWDTAGTP
jgi:hypothetical protein